jgi:xanthine/CO dehydrogenase XdhC/CoxF family maturation factor
MARKRLGEGTVKELLNDIDQWRAEGQQVAIATVVKVEGSAPRPVGATMAVSSGGDLAGSVSGGCVETAVFDEAQEVLKTGTPKLIRYGITDEMAWDVGLACGGTIEVFVQPIDGTTR